MKLYFYCFFLNSSTNSFTEQWLFWTGTVQQSCWNWFNHLYNWPPCLKACPFLKRIFLILEQTLTGWNLRKVLRLQLPLLKLILIVTTIEATIITTNIYGLLTVIPVKALNVLPHLIQLSIDRLYLLFTFYKWNSEKFHSSKSHTSVSSRTKFLTKFDLALKSCSQLLHAFHNDSQSEERKIHSLGNSCKHLPLEIVVKIKCKGNLSQYLAIVLGRYFLSAL